MLRWSGLPSHGVEVRSQEFGEHWGEYLRVGVEELDARVGGYVAIHHWPMGGSTLLSCVTHPGGIQHTLESVQHRVVLEKLIN
jgi:hypothetical protein